MLLKVTTINSDNGLPNEQVHAIARDKFGRLWLASPTGLSRYNGSRIKIFDQTNGLDCIGLRTVRVSEEGTVWIGTDRGLEAICIEGNKKNYEKLPEWDYGIAESIFIDDKIIWVGTSFGLLKLFSNTEDKELQLLQKEDLGLVRDIIRKDEINLLVISAKQGLLEYNETGWRNFNIDNLPTGDSIICIASIDKNEFLVGTTAGLFILDSSGKMKCQYSQPGNTKVTAINVSGGELWMGIGHNLLLAKYQNEQIEVIETVKIQSVINEIYIDPDENVWIATNNLGLKRVSCLRKALQQVNFGKNAAAFSIKPSGKNNLLQVGGDGFLCMLETAQNRNKIKAYWELPGIVWDTCIDPVDSTLTWIATEDGLFFSKNEQPPEKFLDSENLITSPNRVLLTKNNEIWLGTIGGLYKIKNGAVTEIKAFDSSRFGYVYTLCLDDKNRVWAGTLGKGLWIEMEDGLKPAVNEFLSSFANTYSLAKNEYGEMLVIQESRLMIADSNLNFRLITTENPVAGWSASWLNRNTIASGCNNGILIIDTDTGKIIQRINVLLGKAAWQFTSTRSLYFDGHDALYCGINSGLFIAGIQKFKQFSNPPELFFEQAEWQNAKPEFKNGVYQIKGGKWSVNVSVFTNWLIDEELIRFRFKMVGFDESWSELSPLPYIRYNSLPAGNYDLLCQVYTPLTGFSNTNELLQIKVTKNILLSGFSPIRNIVYAANESFLKSGRRNKLLRKRNVELEQEIAERKQVETALLNSKEELRQLTFLQEKIREEERLRMSREVHDELGQALTGIKMSVAWLKKKLHTEEKTVAEKFDETLNLVDETTKTVRRISTELRPGLLDSFGIIAALEWQANEFEKRTGVKIEFYTNCPELTLEPEKSIVLFRIFQECLTNTSRYAEANVVLASVEMENDRLIMKIRDNGKGFIPEEVAGKKTLGLLGMKERARMIDADLIINSSPGKGTVTEVKFSLSKINT